MAVDTSADTTAAPRSIQAVVALAVALPVVLAIAAAQWPLHVVDWPRYMQSWLLILFFVFAMKAMVIVRRPWNDLRHAGAGRLLGFLLAWPGMRLDPFIIASRSANTQRRRPLPATALYVYGVANSAAGVALLLGVSGWTFVQDSTLLRIVVGLAGIGLLILFGVFQLLTALWRTAGVDVEKQWHFLPGSSSLGEYWSSHWNRSVHDFARENLYRPLRRRLGRARAVCAVFLISGLMHDVVISLPAGGGYGLPTLFFLIQAGGILIERKFIPQRWHRAWGGVVLACSLPALFHPWFLQRVVIPQLTAIGA